MHNKSEVKMNEINMAKGSAASDVSEAERQPKN